jgi:uncharacterized damage-inducible protein DinB
VNSNDPRYPVGKFDRKDRLTSAERAPLIQQIADAPARMRDAVRSLDEKQLDTPYRDGGWTVRQVVHHVPDSHLNAYIRYKFALTEDAPTIKPYDEAEWAKLPDSRDTPIETSLRLLESLHDRWLRLIRATDEKDFQRTMIHPEHPGPLTLDSLIGLYAWHGRHHVAHITSLRERMGW